MLRKLFTSLAGLGLAAIGLWFYLLLDQPVRMVDVSGELTPGEAAEVHQLISETPPGRLLSTDLNALRKQVLALSWPRRVSIRRIWPHTISVSVERETLVAQWSDEGYLSGTGKLVKAPDNPVSTPYFECAIANPKEALETYRHLQRIADEEGLAIAELTQNALSEWRVKLANGAQATLGAKLLHDRMHRLLAVHRQLSLTSDEAVRYVDLRYSHGVAIRWQDKSNFGLLAEG